MSQLIHNFNKNVLEEVRVSLEEYKGNRYIDLRVYFKADDEFKPSKKGLTLSPDLLPELEQAVQKLKEAIGQGGNG
jgi:hypothetical protein